MNGRPAIRGWRGWIAGPGWHLALILVLLGLRFLHFRPVLDGPHEFRQSDTAMYALGFYKYEFNILRPSVCWRGNYRLYALEFPIHEFLAAVLYKAFGPHLALARLVTLLFFAGSAWYLYRVLCRVAEARLARVAVVLYCAFPLGFVYSRAVHIDAAALCFAHASLYYLLLAADRPGLMRPALAAIAGALAWTVKAPYVFYLYVPLACHVLRPPLDWRRIGRVLAPTAVSLLAFVAWQWHSHVINTGVPDWPYVQKTVDAASHYFGTLDQRLNAGEWTIIVGRLLKDVACFVGVVPLAIGAGAALRGGHGRFIGLWLAGLLLYLLVFFSLNARHDYYQLPFLAVFAAGMGFGIEWFRRRVGELPGRRARWADAAAEAALVGCVAWFTWYGQTQLGYYTVDPLMSQTGAVLQDRTPDDALVIASYPEAGVTTPHVLFAARRLGWSLPSEVLGDQTLRAYRQAGATHLALIAPGPADLNRLRTCGLPPPEVRRLAGPPATQLLLFDLRGWPTGPASPG